MTIKEYYAVNRDKWVEYKPKNKGIYMLSKDNYVVYVGSSNTSIYNRIAWHKSKGRDFDKVHYWDFTGLEITEEEIRDLEYYFMSLCDGLKNCSKHDVKNTPRYDLLAQAPFRTFNKDDLSVKLFRW